MVKSSLLVAVVALKEKADEMRKYDVIADDPGHGNVIGYLLFKKKRKKLETTLEDRKFIP